MATLGFCNQNNYGYSSGTPLYMLGTLVRFVLRLHTVPQQGYNRCLRNRFYLHYPCHRNLIVVDRPRVYKQICETLPLELP